MSRIPFSALGSSILLLAVFASPSAWATAATTTVYLTSGTSWSVPTDWNSSANSIEVTGGGGGGGGSGTVDEDAAGGGGGAYSQTFNVTLSGSVTYAIGSAGGGGGANSAGTAGGDTYFCSSTSNCASISGTAVVVGAKGGSGAPAGTSGTVNGGAAASGIGSTKYSGGLGGRSTAPFRPGGGGGAAGQHGAGGDAGDENLGTAGIGGTGDNGSGGAGGTRGNTGSDGANFDATHGSGGGGGGGATTGGSPGNDGGNYGAGGGGGNAPNSAGGSGKQGLIIISYTAAASDILTLTGNVQFLGNLTITGALSKASGTFVIDHPLNPRNKLLYHSFVESPDALNLYDGIATFDKNGDATVDLPSYWEALNRDPRYQFFPLYKPMPNLYVKQEVTKNRFVIGGGIPKGKVSWQVTCVRHDPYIMANPINVEVDKSSTTVVNQGECLFAPLCE